MGRKFRGRCNSDVSSSSDEERDRSRSRSRSRSSRREASRFKRESRSGSRSSRGSARRSKFNNPSNQRRNRYTVHGRHDFLGQNNRREKRSWNDRNFFKWGPNTHNHNNETLRRFGRGNEVAPFPVPFQPQSMYVCPEALYPTQPPKLTFKRFVLTLEDDVTEKDSMQRYKTYLAEFNKDQIREFFLKHKDEDWFKCKYYPGEYEAREEERTSSFKQRRDVFMKLLSMGKLSDVTLDTSCSEKLEQLLDLASNLMDNKSSETQIQSIFLKNISPLIAASEIKSTCQNFPGFLRVYVQDPEPEKRFSRKGWITFGGNAAIVEICEHLNKTRIRDCDMGAVVNRELRQRVRAVNGLSVHKSVAKQDIKHAAKIIQSLDKRWKMWEKSEGEKEEQKISSVHENQILRNASKFLVDEIDYEEAILGNVSNHNHNQEFKIEIDRDGELLKVMDCLLLYLRIVYSIDYYGSYEYHQENEMPHRCGIIHVRGVNAKQHFTQFEVDKYLKMQETNTQPFLNRRYVLNRVEALDFGMKNQEEEVEKFIASNTQEIEKDKWLCPLSGKKFKGPEFVKKHILSKHEDKIDDVKKEINYFNNFLCDPNRPSLPEHPSNHHQFSVLPPQPVFDNSYERFNIDGPCFNGHQQYPRRGRYPQNIPFGDRNSGHLVDRRPIISYHDYDAEPID